MTEVERRVGNTWAVIPVKNPADAKQRLSGALEQVHREGLFRAMVTDVLQALADATALAGVLVVTRDEAIQEMALGHGMGVYEETRNDGHTQAVQRGIDELMRVGASSILTMPGDIPLVTGEEIDTLVGTHEPAPAISIAPAGDEQGTNGIVLSPPDVITLHFGNNSYFPHVDSARARGIEPKIVPLRGFALDVDRPDDLAEFRANASSTQAYSYLTRHNLLP
jgi:2-phospho-L-lactate/phosphoenolpyruvate guanylyltransferase